MVIRKRSPAETVFGLTEIEFATLKVAGQTRVGVGTGVGAGADGGASGTLVIGNPRSSKADI